MLRRFTLLLVTLSLLAACGASPSAPATQATSAPATRTVTLAMSFIPNIQFAPYYVAKANGYYAAEGLDVVFDYNFENDVALRAATWPESNVEFATVSGTSVLLARQQGVPIQTVMTLYQDFPVVFFSKGATELNDASDLVGQQVGIPGRFGESYFALLALLYSAGLSESDLNVQEIGFTQAQAVLEDQIDIATGYAMNEPVFLASQGETVNILRVADLVPLAANGLAVSERLVTEDPELIRAFVRATLRGLADTLADVDAAFDLALTEIPEANLGDLDLQREVLKASLPYWESELTASEGLGFTDASAWQETVDFMLASDLLPGAVEIERAFTNEFLP